MQRNWFHKMMVLFTSGAFLLMCWYSIYRKLFIYPQTGIIFTTWRNHALKNSIDYYLLSKNGGFGFYGFPIEDQDCLDMMFSYIGLHWGTAAFIIISAAIIYAIYKASREQHTSFLILLFFFLVYGWAEVAPYLSCYISYLSLLLGYYIMNRKPFYCKRPYTCANF